MYRYRFLEIAHVFRCKFSCRNVNSIAFLTIHCSQYLHYLTNRFKCREIIINKYKQLKFKHINVHLWNVCITNMNRELLRKIKLIQVFLHKLSRHRFFLIPMYTTKHIARGLQWTQLKKICFGVAIQVPAWQIGLFSSSNTGIS